jgi:hypothetical protein
METWKANSPVRLYDTPAVVYEAALVAYAGITTQACSVGCGPCAGSDLLAPFTGQ